MSIMPKPKFAAGEVFRFTATDLNTGPVTWNGWPVIKTNGDPLTAGEIQPGESLNLDPDEIARVWRISRT